MAALARLTRRLAELDAERQRLMIAIEVTQQYEPAAKGHGETLAAKALASLNGASRNGVSDGASRNGVSRRVAEWMRTHPTPQKLADVTRALNAEGTASAVSSALYRLSEQKQLKVVARGTFVWKKGASASATRAPKRTTTTKAAKTKARRKPGELAGLILDVLKHAHGPMPYVDIRDALGATGQQARVVGMVLATSLVKKGLVRKTKDGEFQLEASS